MSSSFSDSDIALHCWNTKIPVRISLSANEISSPSNLKPIYLLVPRQGYLPKYAHEAITYFKHVLASLPGQESLQPWFDYKGLPLKWSLPIGVLYDLLVENRDLPWDLTVHLQGSPEAAVALDGRQTMVGLFLNALKEAAFICRGTEGPSSVMQMSSLQQEELWAAVQVADYKEYRRVLDTLRLVPTQKSGSGPSIPVRLLLRSGKEDAGFLSTWEVTYSTSRPLDALGAESQPLCLADALSSIRPAILEHLHTSSPEAGGTPLAAPSSSPSDPLSPPEDTPSTSSTDPPLAPSTTPEASTPTDRQSHGGDASAPGGAPGGPPGGPRGATLPRNVTVLVNGIQPPLETPLAWLHANLHSADCFLYIVVHT